MASNTVINTNITALTAHRNLSTVGTKQSKASQRLSSGKKINSAADDAAGLAISEKMRAQINGLDMAAKNGEDAISLIQTAEGSMSEIESMLQRMRELTVQASSDTNTTADRSKMANEIQQLQEEITDMAGRTEFNTKKLATGSYSAFSTGVTLSTLNFKVGGADLANDAKVNGETYKNKDTSDKTNTLTIGDYAYYKEDGKIQISLNSADINLTAGKNYATLNISDLQYESDGSAYLLEDDGTKKYIPTGGGTPIATKDAKRENELYFQIGANQNQKITLNIDKLTATGLGVNGIASSIRSANKGTGKGASEISDLIDVVDSAITAVSDARANLGAKQNRLEYTINNLNVSSENLSSAKSRIEDADMAKEMMNLTKANVLQQAATSMLAQANSSSSNITQLLG